MRLVSSSITMCARPRENSNQPQKRRVVHANVPWAVALTGKGTLWSPTKTQLVGALFIVRTSQSNQLEELGENFFGVSIIDYE